MTEPSRILGVIGYPLGHSVSAPMHTAALEALGLPTKYLPFETPPASLKATLEKLKASNFLGINVTIPHKEAVIPLLDEVDDTARRIGAVNTICHRDGALIGFNTDAPGFLEALTIDGGMDPAGRNVLVLGTGGAARAVGFALVQSGVKSLTFAGRSGAKAARLIADLKMAGAVTVSSSPWSDSAISTLIAGSDLIVNATPLGMFPKAGECPLSESAPLSTHHALFDLVYNPLETRLIRMAKEAGTSTIVGIHMLVRQGALAFKLFTGREPSIDLMRQAAIEALRKQGAR